MIGDSIESELSAFRGCHASFTSGEWTCGRLGQQRRRSQSDLKALIGSDQQHFVVALSRCSRAPLRGRAYLSSTADAPRARSQRISVQNIRVAATSLPDRSTFLSAASGRQSIP